MATLLKIGDYQNDSEKWAAEYLAEKLPSEYNVYAGLCVVYDKKLYEVDIIVAGGYAVHFVDVKGLAGHIQAGQGTWLVNGRYQDFGGSCPYHRVVTHAKSFKQVWENCFRNDRAPWFQGCIFVTGNRGEGLTLVKSGQDLRIFEKDGIVKYLQTSEHPSESNRITGDTLKRLEHVLALSHHVSVREQRGFSGFSITRRTPLQGGQATWNARYALGSLQEMYQLEVVGTDASEPDVAVRLKAQKAKYKLLSDLHGVAGIPRALAPISDHDRHIQALPIRSHEGVLMSKMTAADFDKAGRVALFRQILACISVCHGRGVFHGGLSPDVVSVGMLGDIEIGGWGARDHWDARLLAADLQSIARMAASLFAGKSRPDTAVLADVKSWPDPVLEGFADLPVWYASVCEGAADSLAPLLAAAREKQMAEKSKPLEIREGAVINGSYRLIKLLGPGSSGEAWEAENVHGNWRCCLKIFEPSRIQAEIARLEGQRLMSLAHPNIVRIQTFDFIPELNRYFIVNELGDRTLLDIIDGEKEDRPIGQQVFTWFSGCVNALEYMHSLRPQVLHRDIKPSNITVTGERATLIDFSISALQDPGAGTESFMMPGLIDGKTQFGPATDLYALCLTFYVLLTGDYPFADSRCFWRSDLQKTAPEGFPVRVWGQILGVLAGKLPDAGLRFSEFLKIGRWSFPFEHPLPREFCDKWDINWKSKLEPYLVAVLLQNGGKFTKKRVVDAVLKWKRDTSAHAGSYDSALAILREHRRHQVLDYPRGRQAAHARVWVTLNEDLVRDWGTHYD